MLTTRVGTWMTEQRARRKWSMTVCGKHLGEAIGREKPFVSSYINNVEKGHETPSAELMDAMALAFETDRAWIQAQADLDRLGPERVAAIITLADLPSHPARLPSEARLLAEIRRLTDNDLDSVQLGPDELVWHLPARKRQEELFDIGFDLMTDEEVQIDVRLREHEAKEEEAG